MADEKPVVATAAATTQPDGTAVAVAAAPTTPVVADAPVVRNLIELPVGELTDDELLTVLQQRLSEVPPDRLLKLQAAQSLQNAAATAPSTPIVAAADDSIAATKANVSNTTTVVNVDCSKDVKKEEVNVTVPAQQSDVIGAVGPNGATWTGKEGVPAASKQEALVQAALSTTSGRQVG